MHDFHDNFIKKHFDAELLFTDTVLHMKENQKIIKNFLNTNIYLTLAILQKTLSFTKFKMRWLLGK